MDLPYDNFYSIDRDDRATHFGKPRYDLDGVAFHEFYIDQLISCASSAVSASYDKAQVRGVAIPGFISSVHLQC